jgi:hypothetical protein
MEYVQNFCENITENKRHLQSGKRSFDITPNIIFSVHAANYFREHIPENYDHYERGTSAVDPYIDTNNKKNYIQTN